MLFGQVEKKQDDKKRFSFPYRFRRVLGTELIITKNMEGSLLVISKKEWKTLLEGTEDKSFLIKEVREVQRFLFGSAIDVELDEKGRFILPEHLKKYSGIGKEAVFVGVNNRVEIWSKNNWLKYSTEHLNKEIDKITQKLNE